MTQYVIDYRNTVSYTHLDVYKRQDAQSFAITILTLAILLCDPTTIFFFTLPLIFVSLVVNIYSLFSMYSFIYFNFYQNSSNYLCFPFLSASCAFLFRNHDLLTDIAVGLNLSLIHIQMCIRDRRCSVIVADILAVLVARYFDNCPPCYSQETEIVLLIVLVDTS